MAGRYCIKAGGTYVDNNSDIWDAINWPNHPIGDTNGFNEGADTATIPVEVTGDFTLGGAMACVALNCGGYTGTVALGANALDINGTLISQGTITGTGNISCSAGITFAAGTDLSGWSGTLTQDGVANTHYLTTAGVTIPNFAVNNALVDGFILQDNMTVGALTFTAGKFTTTGCTVTLRAGTHDVDWDNTTYALAHIIIPDAAKAELTGILRFAEITFGDGVGGASVASAAAKDLMLSCGGNDKWHQTAASGTVSVKSCIIFSYGDYEVGYLDGSNFTNGLILRTVSASQTLTMTDNWTMGAKTLALEGLVAGHIQTLDTNGHGLTAGAVTLGIAAAEDKSGVMLIRRGGIVSVDSIVAGDAANQHNALDVGPGFLELASNTDLTGVAVTSAGGTLFGAVQLDEFNCTGVLWAPQASDGANNGDVLFRGQSRGTSTGTGTSCMAA